MQYFTNIFGFTFATTQLSPNSESHFVKAYAHDKPLHAVRLNKQMTTQEKRFDKVNCTVKYTQGLFPIHHFCFSGKTKIWPVPIPFVRYFQVSYQTEPLPMELRLLHHCTNKFFKQQSTCLHLGGQRRQEKQIDVCIFSLLYLKDKFHIGVQENIWQVFRVVMAL